MINEELKYLVEAITTVCTFVCFCVDSHTLTVHYHIVNDHFGSVNKSSDEISFVEG